MVEVVIHLGYGSHGDKSYLSIQMNTCSNDMYTLDEINMLDGEQGTD